MSALKWSKANNLLYKDIQIGFTSIGVELTDMGRTENDDTDLLNYSELRNSVNAPINSR